MTAYKLTQIILDVPDMAPELHFYRDVLGFKVIYPQGLANYSQEMWVELDAGVGRLTLHGGADGTFGHPQEIVFSAADLKKALQDILSAGIKIGHIHILENGTPLATSYAPAGHRFSIRD